MYDIIYPILVVLAGVALIGLVGFIAIWGAMMKS